MNRCMDRNLLGQFKKGCNLGKNHPMWKGDSVGYFALHDWVKRNFKNKKRCSECFSEENIELANISKKYKRDINDWKYLCKKCHHIFDDVYTKMMVTRKINNLPTAKGNGKEYICKVDNQLCRDGYSKYLLCKKHYLNKYYRENRNKWDLYRLKKS